MKKYDTYKDSGNQWIGQVPEHWCLYSLKYYLNLQKGRKPEVFVAEGDLPYVTMDYIRSRENKTCLYPSSTEGLVPINDNDMLVLWDGANAGEIVKAKKGFLSSTMAVLDFDKKIGLSQYLFYLLKKMEPTFKTFANGTTIPHFDSSILLDYKYPLPPLSEQQAIVEFLDKKTGQIDQSIALLETQKTDLQAYRQALITETVTKGLNPNAPMKDSGNQWIGQVPEHWCLYSLKYYLTLQKGRKPEVFVEEGDLPYVTMDYIRSRENKSCLYPSSAEGLVPISDDDILVLWDGANAGEIVKAKKGFLSSTMAVLDFDKKIGSHQYLFYLLKQMEPIFKTFANGTTIPHFDSSILLDYKYPLPPLSEQQDIVEYLDKKTSDIDAALKQIDTQIADLQAYRTALISEVVTGKIDVRNQ